MRTFRNDCLKNSNRKLLLFLGVDNTNIIFSLLLNNRN